MGAAQIRQMAVFRADASPAVGGGHVMRCLALAEALTGAGWSCGFAAHSGTLDTVPTLPGSGHDWLVLDGDEVDEATWLARRWPGGCDLLAVDHYGRDSHFERAARPWAKRILVIDDSADRAHDCDLLLDQTPGRKAEDYAELVPGHCRMLLGPDYALLRPQFTARRKAALAGREEGGPVRRILVNLGATDPDNVTGIILEGIARSGVDAAVDVVLGATAPHLSRVQGVTARMRQDVSVHVAVDDMAALVIRANLAIGAAGSASLERCCLGLPTLMVVLAENQRTIAAELERAGAARCLGWHANLGADRIAEAIASICSDELGRREIAKRAAAICDGRGTTRVLLALLKPEAARDGTSVDLRLADMADCDTLLRWQSDRRTRRFSRDPAAPGPAEHRLWMEDCLADPNRLLMVILHGGEPAGALRLDRRGRPQAFEVSILVAPEEYRLGIAVAALALARKLMPAATFHAELLPGNEASRALFRRAGYWQSEGHYLSEPHKCGRVP